MKKLLTILFASIVSATICGCAGNQASRDAKVLTVYSWEDYIDETLLEEFEEYYFTTYKEKITLNYNTFATNETMYNNFMTGKTAYDLLCPSDYIIQKMINNNQLETFDLAADNTYSMIDNYNEYGSPYIKQLFDSKEVLLDGEVKKWSQYSLPYMWGTVGLLYNVDAFESDSYAEDMTYWASLWSKEYKNTFTMKNSVRDSFFVGLVKVYEDELINLANDYKDGIITGSEYNNQVSLYLNKCDDETIKKVEKVLKELKNNSFGLEVDSGKNDIATGKIMINMAWSGDAVYAIEVAGEQDIELNYSIPQLGSNIWFDGWVMPKGANKSLAQEFLNFISSPDAATRNMNEIGYTSAIAGQEVFDMMVDWYGADEEAEDLVDYDLTYFFDGTLDEGIEPKIKISSEDYGIISAQYPDEETILRCAIMEDFGNQDEKIVAMWSQVKVLDVPNWLYILVGALLLAFIGGFSFYVLNKNAIRRQRKNKKV